MFCSVLSWLSVGSVCYEPKRGQILPTMIRTYKLGSIHGVESCAGRLLSTLPRVMVAFTGPLGHDVGPPTI
ncbi:hypothetical protein HD806DRAFT_488837 [Xylariaceae sp. AK1471]|nr:hypothetical protein HD806DRAFT_488837 [Xylariaceae sp. AK1471]